jgi:hypothetical protein
MRVRYASEMDGPVLGGGLECGACHKNGCFDTVDFARITKQLLGRTSAGLLPRSSGVVDTICTASGASLR